MLTLRTRRESLGLTQADLAQKVETTPNYISMIESGKVKLPNAELRRAISAALGIRHVDFLVAVGELEDWEVPGFSAEQPERDPDLARRIAMLEQLDLDRDNRGSTLDVVLQGWAAQDRARSSHPGQRNGTRG